MHRDPWIPAEDRTKVFRLFGCSLSPLASGLWPAPDPSAPKGQKEIAQGIAKRRPGYACFEQITTERTDPKWWPSRKLHEEKIPQPRKIRTWELFLRMRRAACACRIDFFTDLSYGLPIDRRERQSSENNSRNLPHLKRKYTNNADFLFRQQLPLFWGGGNAGHGRQCQAS